jgi:hypothetical protein
VEEEEAETDEAERKRAVAISRFLFVSFYGMVGLKISSNPPMGVNERDVIQCGWT